MDGVLFYVQSLLGIGHLRRTTLIAEAVTSLGLHATIVSGGIAIPVFSPEDVEIIQLPPLQARSGSFREHFAGEDRLADEAYKRDRVNLLKEHVRTLRPRIVVVESFPFGRWPIAYELLAMLEEIESLRPRPVVVSSIRDILQASAQVDRHRRIRDVLDHYFDAVLVHGDPDFVSLSETYPGFESIRGLVHYTGLVAPVRGQPDCAANAHSEVVVSIGGGAVVRSLLWTALEVRPKTSLANHPWRLITGPNFGQDELEALSAASPGNVFVERFRKDFFSLLAGARLAVSMAGYNTVAEILCAAAPAVLIAYTGEGRETEQVMRAEKLVERGLVAMLKDQDLTPEKLAEAIELAVKVNTGLHHGIDLDGARKSAELLKFWLDSGRPVRSSS